MARFDPIRSPVLDTLIAHRQPLEAVERPPRSPSPLSWLRLALIGFTSIAVVVSFHFPPWAVLVLPVAALATQAVRRWRWLSRAAWSAVFAAYLAQVVRLALTTWVFRFGAAFALLMAAGLFWGLRMDEFD